MQLSSCCKFNALLECKTESLLHGPAKPVLIASNFTLLKERIAARLRNFTEAYRDVLPALHSPARCAPYSLLVHLPRLGPPPSCNPLGVARPMWGRQPAMACLCLPLSAHRCFQHASRLQAEHACCQPLCCSSGLAPATHMETGVSTLGDVPVPKAAAKAASAVLHFSHSWYRGTSNSSEPGPTPAAARSRWMRRSGRDPRSSIASVLRNLPGRPTSVHPSDEAAGLPLAHKWRRGAATEGGPSLDAENPSSLGVLRANSLS